MASGGFENFEQEDLVDGEKYFAAILAAVQQSRRLKSAAMLQRGDAAQWENVRDLPDGEQVKCPLRPIGSNAYLARELEIR